MECFKQPSFPFTSFPSHFLIIGPVVGVHPRLLLLVALVAFVLVIRDVLAGTAGSLLALRRLAACRAVLGVIDLPSQAEVLALLTGTLVGAHLQGGGGVVALVCSQLLVVDSTPRTRRGHAGLEDNRGGKQKKSLSGVTRWTRKATYKKTRTLMF